MPGKLLLVLALGTACAAQKEAGRDKPMITRNPDGTFTAQKQPKGANAKTLVIRPQVVVPIVMKKRARHANSAAISRKN